MLALVVLLALTALFHGALVLARSRIAAAGASADHLRHRLAAEGAARVVSRRIGSEGLDGGRESAVPKRFEIGLSPEARARVEARFVSDEWLWLEATAYEAPPGSVPRARVGRVLWTLDPATRAGTFAGQEGVVASTGARSLPGPGLPDPDRVPPLGLLDGPELMRRAGAVIEEARVVGPDRTDGSACLPTSGERPALEPGPPPRAVAGIAAVLRVRDGDLTLRDVRWTGVLVVSGDLALTGTARFDGVVLVGGGLLLRPGTCLRGAARAADGVHAEPGAQLLTSPERVEAVLRRVPRLTDPLPASPSSWIDLD